MDTTKIIETALNYIRLYGEQIIVIKYGGPLMTDEIKRQQFAKNIVLIKHLGIHPVIIHGGGYELQDLMGRLNIQPKYHKGVQVQSDETLPITEMVLTGSINPSIVSLINQSGGKAVGLSGKDSNLLQAKKLKRRDKDLNSNIEKIIDLGHVGETYQVNPLIIHNMIRNGIIPVISPIGIGKKNQTYILNPDMAAANLAIGLKANRLIYVISHETFMDNQDFHFLNLKDYNDLCEKGTIPEHMYIVSDGINRALSHGINSAILLNGNIENAMLLELTTDQGCGIAIYDSQIDL